MYLEHVAALLLATHYQLCRALELDVSQYRSTNDYELVESDSRCSGLRTHALVVRDSIYVHSNAVNHNVYLQNQINILSQKYKAYCPANFAKSHDRPFRPLPIHVNFSRPRTLEARQGFAPTSPTIVISSIVPAVTPTTLNSLAINQDGDDISYFSFVQFGSANKTFSMAIDTGSADTWLYSSTCTNKSCMTHMSFGQQDSSSLVVSSEGYDISYGSGMARGHLANDMTCLAKLCLEKFDFGLTDNVSDEFINFPIDGILGLAMSQASQIGLPGLIESMFDQDIIQNKIFAISLHRAASGSNDGVISFGGFDPSRIIRGIEGLSYNAVVSNNGLWNIIMDNVWMDDIALQMQNRTVVLDTGTSLILVPPEDALQMHKLITGTLSNGETYYIPCNTTAKLEFEFNGQRYLLDIRDYVGEVVDAQLQLCLSRIVGREVLQDQAWLVGDVFLKNVYTVVGGFGHTSQYIANETKAVQFDKDQYRVGFGRKTSQGTAQLSSSSIGLRPLALPPDIVSASANVVTSSSGHAGATSQVSALGTQSSSTETRKNTGDSSKKAVPHIYALFVVVCAFLLLRFV